MVLLVGDVVAPLGLLVLAGACPISVTASPTASSRALPSRWVSLPAVGYPEKIVDTPAP